jgi:uncharacterized protein YfeS
MPRTVDDILRDIEAFGPRDGNWLPFDDLLADLWHAGMPERALPVLFGVFERFPNDDGAGVLWGIVHGVQGLDLDYEQPLRESLARQPSYMGKIMLGRLERSKAGSTTKTKTKAKPLILDPIFTDTGNEYGPLGNDTGADVFAHYQQWRESGQRASHFLPYLLQAWEIGDYGWEDLDANVIVEEMQRSEQALFERLTRDDAIIALVFAQIMVDGEAQPKVLERALKAVQRQSQDRIIEFRGWVDPEYRKEVLAKVAAFLMATRGDAG